MKPTPEKMRSMGFSDKAEPVEMSDAAWACFKAWVNVKDPPAEMRWAPKGTVDAWERVAKAKE